MTLTFGKQRPRTDIAAAALLLVGFAALAYAMWISRGAWLGWLLPLAFAIGAAAGFRTEVRQVDLADDSLEIRTFFRAYPIPRAHIVHVELTTRGVAIDVLNGARYFITPQGVEAEPMYRALVAWHAEGAQGIEPRPE